jgi:hypothetical protein
MQWRQRSIRQVRRPACTVAAVATALAVIAPTALAAGILTDGGFEKPRASSPSQFFGVDSSLGTCTPGTARLCWLVRPATIGGGLSGIDLVTLAGWQPEKGSQSVELNGGAHAAALTQSFTTGPGLHYKVSYWVAGNPAFQGPEPLRVTWEDVDGHGSTLGAVVQDVAFDTTGHTTSSMGWQKHTLTVTTLPGTFESRLFLESTTNVGNDDIGPAVDMVNVKQLR